MVDLDDLDRGILHELQLDARNTTARAIADKVGASASTVRNRIDRLEETGVIEGYHPKLDYEAAGLSLQLLFVCSADPTERAGLVDALMAVRGVIDVRETMTGRRNVYVEVIATSTSEITPITDAIHAMPLSIESTDLLRQRRVQPFNHFHVGDGDDG